jgi:hypothetical protein
VKSYQIIDFGRPLAGVDLPDPKPSDDEVVIAVKAAGVCHSDLHLWEGGFDLGGGRRLTLKDRGVQLPLTLGHETAGEILSVGPNVTDRQVGEMCLIDPWIGCGACPVCRDGNENLCMKPRCLGIHCDGGYSDKLVVPHSKYLLPLKGLDPVAAAPLACSGVTTYSALKKLVHRFLETNLVRGIHFPDMAFSLAALIRKRGFGHGGVAAGDRIGDWRGGFGAVAPDSALANGTGEPGRAGADAVGLPGRPLVLCGGSRTKAWLAEQPTGRFAFTFTPKHGSWLNLVEGFFSKLARSVLRHIRVASKQELKERIMAAMDHFNRDPVVHTWSYKLDQAA